MSEHSAKFIVRWYQKMEHHKGVAQMNWEVFEDSKSASNFADLLCSFPNVLHVIIINEIKVVLK